ncbi:hypothetical protein ACTOXX_34305 [Streptomyces rubiginosohelvolus]|uniref:hypothetical protein n=1 Tax=Streptomyces rubiginosohelvolus TaxID=67362 RepID=UPI003F8DBD9C
MTKPRLTYAQHDELGGRLAAMRSELLALQIQLMNAYPRSGRESVPGKRLEQARHLLGEALDELENCLYDEHPHEASLYVYSRGRE